MSERLNGLRGRIIRGWMWDAEALILVKDMPCADGITRPHLGKVTWEQREEGFAVDSSDATLVGREGEISRFLLDVLREAGAIETEVTGKLVATQRHLEDMRALVFKSGKP